MSDTKEVWAYVAHKEGKFVGAISTEAGQKEVGKFCGGFIASGFTITPTYNRDEYLALIEPMGIWEPEKKRKAKSDSQDELDLEGEDG